jgi:hypothetical protein
MCADDYITESDPMLYKVDHNQMQSRIEERQTEHPYDHHKDQN